jgi:hypothetical protein
MDPQFHARMQMSFRFTLPRRLVQIVRHQFGMVLRDRLGQCLVGLKREQQINSLRDLGLVCLTRGLVRRTRHHWNRRRGSCR